MERKNNKENILKEFDDLLIFKKQNAVKTKGIMLFCALIVFASFLLIFVIYVSSLQNIIVVSSNGEYLQRVEMDRENADIAFIENTCAIVSNKLNSFDRLNYEKRVSDLVMYVNTADLNAVYLKYKEDNSYNDALLNGYVYSCTFQEIESIEKKDDDTYKVVFSSLLSIKGFESVKFKIVSTGELTRVTPDYPSNITGFFFTKLDQSYQKVKKDEREQG